MELPSFGDMIRGTVGHMAAFRTRKTAPGAVSYFPKNHTAKDPYYYVTWRDWGDESLACFGGPERELRQVTQYHSAKTYVAGADRDIRRFAKK